MPTNIRENGLEEIISEWIVKNNKYELGNPKEYNSEYALDTVHLLKYLRLSGVLKEKNDGTLKDTDIDKFVYCLDKALSKSGVIEVLRKGIVYKQNVIKLYNHTSTEQNIKAHENFNKNIFSITRQVHFSKNSPNLSIDICIFINGLPVITIEVKNELTHQTYEDAIKQYKLTRSSREKLFIPGRCMVHFALDENECWMCPELNDNDSDFRPFNKGFNHGGGNPIIKEGLKTEYLWKAILSKESLADIIQNYAQKIKIENKKNHQSTYRNIFPRYHQLDVVRKLVTATKINGLGNHYLVQHSAGSGKSNSIAWLAFQLAALEKMGHPTFDSILVITDRRNLDSQIRTTIKGFADKNLKGIYASAKDSADLSLKLSQGKRIITTTLQKFPKILDKIHDNYSSKKFAIIIDEAHSSQNGRMSAEMNIVLSDNQQCIDESKFDEIDTEDIINNIIEKRKMLKNACYYAFTATPKKKTLETFGQEKIINGKIEYLPFHEYSMKQAIAEKYIMDVLENYITVKSYYSLLKLCENDPKYDKQKAQKLLRNYVESRPYTISEKANIIIEHFRNEVDLPKKIGGNAKAMVVTSGIEQAIDYFFAMRRKTAEMNLPYKMIIAFSGTKKIGENNYSETSLNGFPSKDIEDTFKLPEYKFLIVADKFQTGYDEPLLHTMYIDKGLSDVNAVQTLSRLNRPHHDKHDTIVMDFYDNYESIKKAFNKYYQKTLLCGNTDPNKLNDLIGIIEAYDIYSKDDIEQVIAPYLHNKSREKFEYILDQCKLRFEHLSFIDKKLFKENVSSFIKSYAFLSAILPFNQNNWEKLSIFLTLLFPKLHTNTEDDTELILNNIELTNYRAEINDRIRITLDDMDGKLKPDLQHKQRNSDKQYNTLSQIIDEFHKKFGGLIQFKDEESELKIIKKLPSIVLENEHYLNAIKNSDEENARLESNKTIDLFIDKNVMQHIDFYSAYHKSDEFKNWVQNLVFISTYGLEKSIV